MKLDMENTNNELFYLGREGLEFVINKGTGEGKISEIAAISLLEVDRHTFLDHRDKLGIKGEIAQIPTASGTQGCWIFSATEFYKLAERLRPVLAEAILEKGVDSYLLYGAGTK